MSSNLFGYKGPRVPHLAAPGSGGLKGEVADLRADVEAAFQYQETNGGYIHTDEFTNVLTADVDGLKLAAATASAIQAFTSANWSGVQGTTEMVPPRNVTVTTSSHANVDAVTVVVVGRVRNAQGVLIAQTDSFALTDGGGVTDAGIKAFAFVDSVTIPAQGGTGGSLSIGFGVLMGLSKKIRSVAGVTRPLREISGAAVVTTGTFATTAPNGTYSAASAPNGTNDYGLSYIVTA